MLKKNLSLTVLFLFFCLVSISQQLFIEKGAIDFEVRTNNHKGIDSWNNDEESTWSDNYKSNTSKFTIKHYNYTFANNKSIYTFTSLDAKNKSQWDNETNYEGDIWYYDFNNGISAFNRNFWRDEFNFTDSITDIKWKLIPTESRIIAGFNCRKAYTVLFDSVYVFAFYTDEINISGGPMGLHGLPGMILGVTVPRMFSSWVATKINITTIDEKRIISPATKKSKTKVEILKKFMKKAEEDGKWMQRNIWSFFL